MEAAEKRAGHARAVEKRDGERRRGRGRSAVAAARARAKTGRGRRAWRGVEKIGMKATLGAVWRDWGKRLRPGGSRDKTVGSTRQF